MNDRLKLVVTVLVLVMLYSGLVEHADYINNVLQVTIKSLV